jgi:uncharacterized protein
VTGRPGDPAPAAEVDGAVWRALDRAETFPEDATAAAGVEWIQTHLSHVYRTGSRVYKFRKPVDLGFVCFASRAERNADCLREIALNRRLAPDVYLGVAPLLAGAGGLRVGPVAEALAGGQDAFEHCVVMRRLPDGRDALSLLAGGRLTAARIDALAGRIARFHADHGLGRPAPFAPEEWLEHCTRPVEENFRALEEAPPEVAPREALGRARERARRYTALHADRFEQRRCDGRAVDAHGDLHLQHVWYEHEDAEPIAIDGLEFSTSLRRIDAASEVAFPTMDLRYRGAAALGERFLRRYALESDDYSLYSVVDYFLAYRAGVRAKVAALAACDAGIEPEQRENAGASARRHLDLATDALADRAPPALVLTAGVVGTGKSTVADALADELGGVVIASDRVRKRLLGHAVTDRLDEGWRAGAYSDSNTERTYAGMVERARPVLASGRCAVLDATFSTRAHREQATCLAREVGCEAWLVEVRCAPREARLRLSRRAATGTDPSDAGPERHAASAAGFESTEEWPSARRVRIHTDRADWREALSSWVARIR